MAKAIMIQGTASNAGKSLTALGLCRLFRRRGFSVAPFKSQNMALNSYITREGLEMGRAQVAQAEAAEVEPSVLMNPILLKPTGDARSQVIVNGEVTATLPAAEYYRRKTEFIPAVRASYAALAAKHDIIVIEGAGSPAEINLRDNDIVNMGMAAMADAPVLLVGDIDRGGVFASLYGTVALLQPEERDRIKGVVINKFRGDVDILRPGLVQLEQLTGIPVIGVVPWLDVDIDDEDSLSPRLTARSADKLLRAVVIRLPRLANFTDFNALERHPLWSVHYAESAGEIATPDLLILPGSKDTMADLAWMRQNGMEAAIKKLAANGVPVMGICGGYQMLGTRLEDPEQVESGGSMRGMELLPVATAFTAKKTRTRVAGRAAVTNGFYACLDGCEFAGYEIHMGVSTRAETAHSFSTLSNDGKTGRDGTVEKNVLGSYVHGLFDSGSVATRLGEAILREKGVPAGTVEPPDHEQYKRQQYDRVADALEKALDMNAIHAMMGL